MERPNFSESNPSGDIARSIEGMLQSQYQNRYWKDIYASTRLERKEIPILANFNANRMIMKILSTQEKDYEDELLSNEEKKEHKANYELKVRFQKNPTGFAYALYDAYMYFYGLGLQSLDGQSRKEAVMIASGNIQRMLDPQNMGWGEKLKKRLFGNVLFPE